MTHHLKNRSLFIISWALFSVGFGWLTGVTRGDLTWESNYVDEDAINDGDSLFTNGVTVTYSTTIFSDFDGGTFDLAAERSANFISFEETTTGNHTGYLEMTFNNENDDPVDFLELTMNFSRPIDNLSFSILDVDGSGAGSWDDGVEIFFNGINVKTDPSLYTIGSAVFLDNESYMDGFEAGTTSASATQTIGNVDLQFGAQAINNIVIRYFSTDDAVADPSSQFIGISDLLFTVVPVPEPAFSIGAFLALFIASARHPTRLSTRA